ncbi:hypothetical protein GGI43DRAFT_379995 [Trichoderma evansii]
MSDSSNSQDLPSFTTFTKEDFLARAAAAQDQLRQQNPDLTEAELDLKLSTGWLDKVFLVADAEKSVPKETHDELQAACLEFVAASYSRNALDVFAAKARTILADHQETLQLIETTVLNKPEAWDQMHKHAISKQNTKNTNV